MRSLRFRFFAFILAILLVLLLLLNIYPITSARDAIFEEKRSSMLSQVTVLSSALSSLDKLSSDGVSDVLRFLDLSGFSRVIVSDSKGNVVYDDGSTAADLHDLNTALTGRAVFR